MTCGSDDSSATRHSVCVGYGCSLLSRDWQRTNALHGTAELQSSCLVYYDYRLWITIGCFLRRNTASSIALRPHTCALKLSADESDTEIAPGPAAGGGGEPAGEFEFAESRMSLLPSLLLPLRPLLPPAEPFLPVLEPFRPAPDVPLRARKLPLPA